MTKIDTVRFIVSMIQQLKDGHPLRVNILYALLNQGLIYTGDSIVRVVNKKEGPSLEEAITNEPVVKRVTQILKESEDWIPKEIIKYLKEKGDFRSCWIAWLEKQGQVKESTISQHENKTCKENDDSLTSEDEHQIKTICSFLKDFADKGYENAIVCIDFLKSLRPQNRWKPDKAVIQILELIIQGKANPTNYQATLMNLVEQLKKLREE